MKVLITGAKGFIAGYLIQELLEQGWEVIGLDNCSKYGEMQKSYDSHPHYRFVYGDAKQVDLLKALLAGCQHFVAGAALVGGIAYFHRYAYDLLAENERLTAAAFDAALSAFKAGELQKITLISSSMVYEHAQIFPTPEGHQLEIPPPASTYGFQKLAAEYFALGAYQQYGLPYTIIRPFNCIGIGEKQALADPRLPSGNLKLAMSHVVPDLVRKILKGQEPLHLLGDGKQIRHYTYGGDLAVGIRLALESPAALNQDFNLASPVSTTVLELAQLIWYKIKGDKPFKYTSDPPFPYDVRKRIPDTSKAKALLGFEAKTSLSQALDEIIPWLGTQLQASEV
jgi:UDP-glucose 4-epimerase